MDRMDACLRAHRVRMREQASRPRCASSGCAMPPGPDGLCDRCREWRRTHPVVRDELGAATIFSDLHRPVEAAPSPPGADVAEMAASGTLVGGELRSTPEAHPSPAGPAEFGPPAAPVGPRASVPPSARDTTSRREDPRAPGAGPSAVSPGDAGVAGTHPGSARTAASRRGGPIEVPFSSGTPSSPPEPAGASRERTPASAPEAPLSKETSMSRKARPLPPREEWLLARLVPPQTLRGRRAIGGACSATRALFDVPFEWVDKPVQDGRISALVVRVPWLDRLQREGTRRGWKVEALAAWPPTPIDPPGAGKAPDPPEASTPVPMLTDAPVPDAPPPCPPVEDLAARAPDVLARGLLLADQMEAIEEAVGQFYKDVPGGPTLDERVRWLTGDYQTTREDLAEVSMILSVNGYRGVPGENLAQRLRRALAGRPPIQGDPTREIQRVRIPLVVEIQIRTDHATP